MTKLKNVLAILFALSVSLAAADPGNGSGTGLRPTLTHGTQVVATPTK